MKKIIVASDSFKGSLTSEEVAGSVKKGILNVYPDCDVTRVYIADGGEGTMQAIVKSQKGKFIKVLASDPLMSPTSVRYGILGDGKTAVIEMASASGLALVSDADRNPMRTSTYGTGEIIRDALLRGCRRFFIGAGDRATNDGGAGLLQALGFRFLDSRGNYLGVGGQMLSRIETIDDAMVPASLRESEFVVACDVQISFYGAEGPARIFGPQKGADNRMVKMLDDGMRHFAGIIKKYNGVELEKVKGAGAAGGMAGGLHAFLGAKLVPGTSMVLEAVRFDEVIIGADLIFTGEGRIDSQTAMGKAPLGVLAAAAKQDIPVIALAGSVEDNSKMNEQGFTAVFPIVPAPVPLEESMRAPYAKRNIERTVTQIMRVIKSMGK